MLAYRRMPIAYLDTAQRRHGERFILRAPGFPPFVFLSDSAEVRRLLTAPAETLRTGVGSAPLAPLIGESSFMLKEQDEHLAGRRSVVAALRESTTADDAALVEHTVRRAVAKWPLDTPFELHSRLRALTLDIMLKKIFGSAIEQRLPQLRESFLEMLGITDGLVLLEPLLRFTPRGHRAWTSFLRHRSVVDHAIDELIDEHRCQTSDTPGLVRTIASARDADGSPVSARQIRDNVMTLISSAHETTASQLEWAFQLLAHNPKVLHTLTREIDSAVGESYLTATLYELLRHRPAFVFAIPRVPVKSFELGGWTYTDPTHLLGCIYLVHHDPQSHPEPHAFRPERFLDRKPDPQTWLPWGGGVKRCPGRHLAMLEIKAVLRAVLSTRTLAPAARAIERPRWRSVVITPHAGSRIVLHKRARAV